MKDYDKLMGYTISPSGKIYFICTCQSEELGWHTVVYECDDTNKAINKKKIIDSDIYTFEEEARKGHGEFIEKYLNKE